LVYNYKNNELNNKVEVRYIKSMYLEWLAMTDTERDNRRSRRAIAMLFYWFCIEEVQNCHPVLGGELSA